MIRATIPSRPVASDSSPEATACVHARRDLAGGLGVVPGSPALSLTLPIRAIGKARARKGRGGTWYTPEATKAAERQIAGAWMAARLGRLSGPLSLRVVAWYAPANSLPWGKKQLWFGRPFNGKPDADNVIKLIADALNGVAYDDDRQIAEASIRQVYAPADRLTIELRAMAHG